MQLVEICQEFGGCSDLVIVGGDSEVNGNEETVSMADLLTSEYK